VIYGTTCDNYMMRIWFPSCWSNWAGSHALGCIGSHLN